LESLAFEDVGIIYGHLVHFTVFRYILWTFGIVRGNLVYFSRFGILYEDKSGNPENDFFQPFWQRSKISIVFLIIVAQFKQGCQIFLGETHQNGKRYQKNTKYTKVQ
jgi:hypothetical protein